MPRTLLCCGSRSETQAKDENPAQSPKDDDVPSYLVQVSNSEGQVWQSSETKLGQHVNVVDASGEQLWELERDGEKSLWSYHVKSNGQKRYVSYDNSETADENVTLELADSGKERYFVALVQPQGGVLLAAVSQVERILWVKNGELCMIPADQLSTDPSWYQSGLPDATIEQQTSYRGQVVQHGSNEKWKSTDAKPQDFIALITTASQEWTLNAVPSQWTFQTHDPQTNDKCYASSTDASPTELMFETILGRANLREFSVKRDPGTSGLVIQSMSNSYYVGKNDAYLQLEEKVEQAVGWEFVISRFVFLTEDGKHVIFPALEKGENPGETHHER